MVEVLLKDLKKGTYFTRKPIENPTESQVYIKDDYNRTDGKYICLKWNDVLGGGIELKGTTKVYVDFIF